VLKAGEYIFVEPKKKKNKSAGNHIVQAGESWLSISQLYGVKKVRLMKMNRAKSDYIKVGASLRLH
jgi:LysM repeat protein